eukprot:5270936-Amphidinium_carterae.2
MEEDEGSPMVLCTTCALRTRNSDGDSSWSGILSLPCLGPDNRPSQLSRINKGFHPQRARQGRCIVGVDGDATELLQLWILRRKT